MTLEVTTPPPRAARIGFWAVAALGPFAALLSWGWFGLAQIEAQTEQCKALAANTSMAGFGELVGGVPLIVAHVVGLAVLVALGRKGYGQHGIAIAIAAVLVASLIGLGVVLYLTGGALFDAGVGSASCAP
ncbi:hypothetical protein ACGGZK_06335 [Agromyces sp. MMS24-K17]|uniref:hypothetical protein n=1 Tax=Agromyces sp. MMS24-K17 TaxID=3372850 RepID=UPI0037541C9C